MPKFEEFKSSNLKLKLDQIAKEIGASCSFLQCCRRDNKMQNPNKTIGPKGTERTSKDDHKRSQVTSKEPAIATDKRVI